MPLHTTPAIKFIMLEKAAASLRTRQSQYRNKYKKGRISKQELDTQLQELQNQIDAILEEKSTIRL